MVHEINICLCGNTPDLGVLLPIEDIGFCRLVIGRIEKYPFNDILDFFNFRGSSQLHLMGQRQYEKGELLGLSF